MEYQLAKYFQGEPLDLRRVDKVAPLAGAWIETGRRERLSTSRDCAHTLDEY